MPDSVQVDGDPETPRIKLKIGARNPEPSAQRLTLKMSGQTETPAKDGVAVDNDALKRQQDLVRTGSASQSQDADATRTRSLRRHIASPRSSVATTPSASEKPQPVPANGRDSHVKDETPQNERSHAVPESTGPSHEGIVPVKLHHWVFNAYTDAD